MEDRDLRIFAARTFLPMHYDRLDKIKQYNQRFVHYCTADKLINILRTKKVWMRRSRLMNDYNEAYHGLDMIADEFRGDNGDHLRECLNSVHENIMEEVQDLFSSWENEMINNTYLFCVSEHDDEEDRDGRLSMWRAYGGNSGVAIILKNTPFLSESSVLEVVSSPVFYFDQEQFGPYILSIFDNIADNSDTLRQIDRVEFGHHIFWFLRSIIHCTKHRGFQEEREWRVCYSPRMNPSDFMKSSIETINGIPEPVYKIPLELTRDKENAEELDLTISSILDSIIIGPTQFPRNIFDSINQTMEELQIDFDPARIKISGIPLRTP